MNIMISAIGTTIGQGLEDKYKVVGQGSVASPNACHLVVARVCNGSVAATLTSRRVCRVLPLCPAAVTCPAAVKCPAAVTCPAAMTCSAVVTCHAAVTCSASVKCPAAMTCSAVVTCHAAVTCSASVTCRLCPLGCSRLQAEIPEDVSHDLGLCVKPPVAEHLAIESIPDSDFSLAISVTIGGEHETEESWSHDAPCVTLLEIGKSSDV